MPAGSALNLFLRLGAVALVYLGLVLSAFLLLRPEVALLQVSDVGLLVRAGFLYWIVASALMVLPFMALMTVPGGWFERGWAEVSGAVMRISNRAFAWGLFSATLALSAFFAIYCFDRRPTTADEIAQLWHARMLLDGRLSMPPDPNPEFFAIDNVIDRPRWMSQFPIGGPAVLAAGMLLGATWLLNPLLTALTALNVYRFCQRAYDEPQARAASAVLLASPMVLIMGGSQMNHTPTLWLVTIALAALPRWSAATTPGELARSAALIGIGLGGATAIRPLDGFVAGTVMALLMLADAMRDATPARRRSLLLAIAAGAIPVVLLLLANWRLTGSPFRFGYEVLWGPNHSLGLHDDPTGFPHTAWRAVVLAAKYALQVNWVVTAWPVPLVLVIAVGLLFGRHLARWDAVLLGLFLAQLAAYAFYFHDGQFVGPRFLFSAVPALLVLAARAPFLIADRFEPGNVWWRIAIVTIPVCIGVTWLRSMKPFGAQALAVEYRETRSRLKVDPPRSIPSSEGGALVFVQEGASARLVHRLWGLGVSRPDAARLLRVADACSLLEAVRAEELRPASDTAGRVARLNQAVRPFKASEANVAVKDGSFRITDINSVTPACAREIRYDLRVKQTIAYGSMLLLNRFDEAGRLGGPVVYAMDLGERNEALRSRFAARRWYRYEIPRTGRDSLPVLVPYDASR